jgi:hypothetical protein
LLVEEIIEMYVKMEKDYAKQAVTAILHNENNDVDVVD